MHEEKPAFPLLRISLFGRQEVWRGSENLPPLATQKTQSLLAYLIIHRNQSHSRQKLATLFWGDYDEPRALHSLATALWRIRKQLGEEFLMTDAETVQFNPLFPYWLDVAEFEERLLGAKMDAKRLNNASVTQLAEAVELYRGDFLEGLYEDWCLDERYRLEWLYLQALRKLIDWHEQQGSALALLAYAQSYLAHDPLDEKVHLSAMRAYMQQGDLLAARRQWQRCCETRLAELHLLPSPLMVEQAKSILGPLFTLPAKPAKPQSEERVRQMSYDRSPFVGRGEEMSDLTTLWEKSLQGQGITVFLAGEAGVGKTRLVEEFSSLVSRSGGLVAHSHCYDPERDLPFQPICEVVETLLQNDLALLQEIPNWQRQELARLLPAIEPHRAKIEPDLTRVQPEQQAVLFQSVAFLIHHFAKRNPLLLVIEDLHWATDTTLTVLHFIARQISSSPILILGTFRQEEIGQCPKLESMVAQLVRNEQAQVLFLERLSKGAVLELIQRMNGIDLTADEVERLYAYTEGNAFYTLETLRAYAETNQKQDAFPIAKSVQALVKSRLSQLSPLANKLIACASVAGRSFDFDLLREVLDLDEEVALEGIEELLRRGFLREGSSTIRADYEFVHQIVQDCAYHQIHHRRRQHFHRKIGEVLESTLVDPSLQAASLAFHFDAGGNLQKTLLYHHLAAQRATAVFAWQEAEQHQGRVLEILTRLDPAVSQQDTANRYGKVLAERAELHYLQGNLIERDRDLEALQQLAAQTQNDRLQLQACMSQTCYLNLDACYERAVALAEEGITLARKLTDFQAQGYLLSQLGFAYYFLGKPQFALQALEQALMLLPADDCETRRHIQHILGYVHFHIGYYPLALENQQQAYRCHQKLGDFNGMVWAGLDIGASNLQLGRLEEGEQAITEHLHLAQQMGARSAEAYGLNQLGHLKLKQGKGSAAIDLFQQSLSRQEGLRTEHGRVAAQLGIGFAYLHLGANAKARNWLETAIEAARRINHRRRLVEALLGLGLTEITAHHFSEAKLCLSEAVEIARDCQSLGNLAAGFAALARLYRRKGELEAALHDAVEAVQLSQELGIAVCEMWAELEMGLIHLARGENDSALKHIQRAVALTSCRDESWIGREQIFRAYALVLHALGCEREAQEQELLAHQMIATKMNWIVDARLRSTFRKAVNCTP